MLDYEKAQHDVKPALLAAHRVAPAGFDQQSQARPLLYTATKVYARPVRRELGY